MPLALIIKTEDCVGCHACEVACKQEHNLPVGPRLLQVTTEGPRMIAGRMQLRYDVKHCFHCSSASCMSNCPVDAISRRPDGVTVIDMEACTGCGQCVEDCQYGMMQFDEVNNVARKCDLCIERLDEGLQPACAAACPSHCIYVAEVEDISEIMGTGTLLDRDKDAVS